MGPLLYKLPLVHHINTVAVANGRQSVGNGNCGAILCNLSQRFLNGRCLSKDYEVYTETSEGRTYGSLIRLMTRRMATA